jgi:hypothetical protein
MENLTLAAKELSKTTKAFIDTPGRLLTLSTFEERKKSFLDSIQEFIYQIALLKVPSPEQNLSSISFAEIEDSESTIEIKVFEYALELETAIQNAFDYHTRVESDNTAAFQNLERIRTAEVDLANFIKKIIVIAYTAVSNPPTKTQSSSSRSGKLEFRSRTFHSGTSTSEKSTITNNQESITSLPPPPVAPAITLTKSEEDSSALTPTRSPSVPTKLDSISDLRKELSLSESDEKKISKKSFSFSPKIFRRNTTELEKKQEEDMKTSPKAGRFDSIRRKLDKSKTVSRVFNFNRTHIEE